MKKDFTIDKVSWHTKIPRNFEFDVKIIYDYFTSIIHYLQENNLTTRQILAKDELVTEDTSILASDLNEEGFTLIKKCFDKWTDDIVDGKKSVNDYKMLDRALRKIRNNTK